MTPFSFPMRWAPPTESACPTRKTRSYAQLQDWEKDAISHRGRALRLMQAKLADDLAVKA